MGSNRLDYPEYKSNWQKILSDKTVEEIDIRQSRRKKLAKLRLDKPMIHLK